MTPDRVASARRQAARGNLRAAVQDILEAWRSDPKELAGYAVALRHAMRVAPLEGALSGMGDAPRGLFELMSMAGESCTDAARFVAPAPDAVGQACFPIVVSAGNEACGALRVFEVYADDGRSDEATGYLPAPFRDSIERARLWVAARCSEFQSVRLQGARWRLRPTLETDRNLAGDSASLAAFVAFASYVLQLPVPADTAFSGVLGAATWFAAPSAATLGLKARALAQRPQIRRFFVPGAQASGMPELSRDVALVGEAAELDILSSVFGQTITRVRAILDLQPAPGTQRTPDRQHEELRLRVAALQVAAEPDPLEVRKLHAALAMPDVWQGATRLEGVVLEAVLNEVRPPSGAASGPPGRRTTGAMGGTGSGDAVRLRAAHKALAQLRQDATVRAYHLHGAGDNDGAGRELAARANDAGEAAWGVVRALERIERQSGVEQARAVAGKMLAGGTPGAPLAHIAWSCAHLPAPLARLALRLERCTTWRDRLLWLHATLETLLHLLAATVAALDASVLQPVLLRQPQTRKELSRRPSLGLLKDVVALAGRIERTDAAGARIAARIHESYGADLDDLVKTLNNALHAPGWCFDLAGQQGEEVARGEAAKVAPALARMIAKVAAPPSVLDLVFVPQDGPPIALLGPVRAPAPPLGEYALRLGDGENEWLPLGGHLARVDDGDAGGIAFYRGVLAGEVRYWSFVDNAEWRGHCQTGTRPDDLLWSASSLGPVMASLRPVQVPPPGRQARCDVSRLPMPVARGVALMRQEPLVRQLAALDAAFGVTLRLVAFACIVAAAECGDSGLASPQWLRRMTKRASLELVQAHALRREATARLGGFLCEGPGAQLAVQIVGWIERLEHVTGPLDDVRPRVNAARDAVEALETHSPWQRGEFTLVGLRHDGLLMDLNGNEAQPRRSPAPGGLVPREVAFYDGEKQAWLRLWPFVVMVEHERGLGAAHLAEVARGGGRDLGRQTPRYHLLDVRAGLVRPDLRWSQAQDRPLGVEVH